MYNFALIFGTVSVLYLIGIFLVKTNKISLIFHRKFWNMILLISFLISGILGLIMAFLIDYKLNISWYQDFLWTHVEFGITMATIAIFHALWHIKYYLSYLPRKK